MDILTKSDFRRLLEGRARVCISIFMPTHTASTETLEDPLRLKNLLHQAEELLIQRGLRHSEAVRILKPAIGLVDDGLFWRNQSHGLAIFASPTMFRYFRLPLVFGELLVVAENFHIRPLLPLLGGDGSFYLLAISQKKVRLFQGTQYGISEVDLKGVPKSLAEALQYDEPERDVQFHISVPGGQTGRGAAMYHGHADAEAEIKENIREYFHKIDKGLHRFLAGETAPSILAGVEFLHPIYKAANNYPHLIEDGVAGNPDKLTPAQLHELSRQIAGNHFRQLQEEAIAGFRETQGLKPTLTELKDVIPASRRGQIETLMIASGNQEWGRFDEDSDRVETHSAREPGDVDLLDVAATQTILHGGEVYEVEPEKMPCKPPLAAILRY